MEFSKRTFEYLKSLDAKLISSEYKITGYNWHDNTAYVNKVDTYRKRNGKKCTVHHKFGMWVQIPDNLITISDKEVTTESNDWFVSHRETITRVVQLKSVSEENQQLLIKIYNQERWKLKQN